MLIAPREFRRKLLAWFDQSRRDLPWRRPVDQPQAPLDPYAVLVSEAMLQQTQVATVIPYFERWMKRFPTVGELAAADEQEVLRHWQGLGYYNRARNLHRAAKYIIGQLDGRFPDTVESLRELPGVGPYTAGAVASIAFNRQAPLVDGNVQRVLTRLYAFADDPRTPEGLAWVWDRAGELVPASRPGDFNSALMELGATICTPRSPTCLLCPVASACAAREKGLQGTIPPPKKAKVSPEERRIVYCLRRPDQTFLLEQRPADGRWAAMWQFPSRVEQPKVGGPALPPHPPLPPAPPHPELPKNANVEHLDEVNHVLTHRRYTFFPRLIDVPQTHNANLSGQQPTAWTTLARLSDYPLPKPHLLIAAQLAALSSPVKTKKRGR